MYGTNVCAVSLQLCESWNPLVFLHALSSLVKSQWHELSLAPAVENPVCNGSDVKSEYLQQILVLHAWQTRPRWGLLDSDWALSCHRYRVEETCWFICVPHTPQKVGGGPPVPCSVLESGELCCIICLAVSSRRGQVGLMCENGYRL